MSFLASLNRQQREAVEHTEGPLLLLAGAGSGKTQVIVTRTAHLVAENGVSPRSILAVTFTNKAAGEMRERVGCLLKQHGLDPRGLPTISTFHAFCVRLLREYGKPLAEHRPGFTPWFQICDGADQLALVKDVMKRLGVESRFIKPREALSAISRAKSAQRATIGLARAVDERVRELNRIYEQYELTLRAANMLDFDDLLLEAVRLLDRSQSVRAAIRERYRYLMVDEYQDTNRPQYQLMLLLARPLCNVCVVGDEDQAIYSWRGADIGNILGFERDFPQAKVIRLEQNYRSTRPILDAAGAVVAHNTQRKGKRLWTDHSGGSRITLYQAHSGTDEAHYVACSIRRLQAADPDLQVGVLYRTNAQSRLIEDALRREQIAYRLVNGVAFYQRKEVKDLLAYLRVALAPEDSLSLARIINVPARGIGKSTLGLLNQYATGRGLTLWCAIEAMLAERKLPPRATAALRQFRELLLALQNEAATADVEALLGWVLARSGYEEMLAADSSPEAESRRENVAELLVAARETGETLQEFLDHVSLVADTDAIESSASVLLMTLHSSKGLEFPAVFLVGMEEELLPHVRSIASGSPDALEEERRLCYVGMTRAQRHLVLSCAASRGQHYSTSSSVRMRPSRFLAEIPSELIDAVPEGSTEFKRTSSAAGGGHEVASRTGPGSRQSPPTWGKTGLMTHDSVEAVQQFFRRRSNGSAGDSGSAHAAPVAAPSGVPRPVSPKPYRREDPVRSPEGVRQLARGARVRHRRFGVGVVQQCQGQGDRAKLRVYFHQHGMKTLIAGPAKLQTL